MELMVAAAILAAILTIGILFIRSSTNDFQYVSKEYTVQNGVRSSMENIGNVIKEATAIFTVGQAKFDPDDPLKMTDGWSYIGLSKDRTRLINYIWVWTDVKNKRGVRKEIDITPSEWNIQDKDNKKIEYEIGFYRDEDNKALHPKDEKELRSRKVVRMSVKGTVKGTQTSYNLSNDILAENLNQIMDSKDRNPSEPITAIAYKVDALEDPVIQKSGADAAFVFVVDTSGSMSLDINAYSTSQVAKKRISILKEVVKKFIDQLEKVGTVDLYIVPFEQYLYGSVSSKDYNSRMINLYSWSRWGTATDTKTIDNNAEKIKRGADEILSLYEGLSWRDGDIEKEARIVVDGARSEFENLKKMPILDPYIKNVKDSRAVAKKKSIADLSEYCLQMLQLPYSLGNTDPTVTNAQALKAKDYVDKRMSPYGATNVGGGIREAYRILQKSNRKLKYVMVLSDGQPNVVDYKDSSKKEYVPAPEKPMPGVPSKITTIHSVYENENSAEKYIKAIMSSGYGMNIKKGSDYFIEETFLVGFSARPQEKAMMRDKIKDFSLAGGGTKKTTYMDANSGASLEAHFEEVVETIQKDMWYFEGP